MKNNDNTISEIKDLLQLIIEDQMIILKEIDEIKDLQNKLIEEVRLNNNGLNNIMTRNEMLN